MARRRLSDRRLERALRRCRPDPPRELVERIVSRVEPGRRRPSLLARAVVAASLAMSLAVAFASFGGLGYASSASMELLASVTQPAASTASVPATSPADDQYKEQRRQCKRAVSAAHSEAHETNRQAHRAFHATRQTKAAHRAYHRAATAAHKSAHDDFARAKRDCDEIGR